MHQITIWEALAVIQEQQESKRVFCRRCGRELKSTKAKELGFGAMCYKKYIQELTYSNRKRLFPVEHTEDK